MNELISIIGSDATPLHFALHTGSLELVEKLLQNGANITLSSKRYGTPEDLAKKLPNSEELLKVLHSARRVRSSFLPSKKSACAQLKWESLC
jgi:hypothetical protein